MKKYLIFLFIFISGCSEVKENKSISHCSDIKYIQFANKNPEVFINSANIYVSALQANKELERWKKENYDQKSLDSMPKLREKITSISYELYGEILNMNSKISDIISLNNKTLDWKLDHKKRSFKDYENYFLTCLNELDADQNKFINKYYEWNSQEILNLKTYARKQNIELMKYLKKFVFGNSVNELNKTTLMIIN